MNNRKSRSLDDFEWPTICLLAAAYASWALSVSGWLGSLGSFLLLSLTLTLHSSLQHEALHGHPTKKPWLNEALVYPALGIFIAYRRFKDTHLAHHRDEILTDPYDDPETNYLDPACWRGLSSAAQRLLVFNNTLLGRISIGPAIGLAWFYRAELGALIAGNRRVSNAYFHHGMGLAPVLTYLVFFGGVSMWLYLGAAYAALGILRIRTFLEHRAHEDSSGRTVVIEDRGPLALLFLNNNFHAVHHKHPRLAWYRLPHRFASARNEFLEVNRNYYYKSYWEIFRRYFFEPKDPVPHPLWPNR